MAIPTIKMDSGIAPPKKYGTAIQRDWSSCLEKYQCMEPWNLESCRTLVSNSVSSEQFGSLCEKFALAEEGQGSTMVDKIMTVAEPEEVELLVSLPTQALGHKMQRGALSFQTLVKKIQLTLLCEKSSNIL